jgi:uncharacterized lipoprotein YddW (UPF0748 family)
MFSPVVRSVVAAFALFFATADDAPVRATWLPAVSLTSQAALRTAVTAAKADGATTLVVPVRATPGPYDALADALAIGHAAGLQVHASINVTVAVPVGELPSARDHVVFRHPEWLMVPRTLAEDLAAVDPHSPEYLGRLSRYARARSATVEGVYLSPATAGAVDYMVGVVRGIVSHYAVDGVRMDAVGYPAGVFDYSSERLAVLVAALRDAVKTLRPAAIVTQ